MISQINVRIVLTTFTISILLLIQNECILTHFLILIGCNLADYLDKNQQKPTDRKEKKNVSNAEDMQIT